jgi:hypothetical protein
MRIKKEIEMILKFIIKDIKAYKKLIFGGLFAHLLLGSMFTFRYYPWNIYAMYGYLVISFFSSIYLFSEKKRAVEILTASLPGTRATIVITRYVTAIIIIAIGLILWLLNAYISELIYTDAMSHFHQIAKLKVLFMALLFISIQLSIFLPAAFSFRIFGMVSTFVVALITAILSIPLIFHPYKRSYHPYFEIGDFPLVALLTLFIIFAPLISATFSITIYQRKDL